MKQLCFFLLVLPSTVFGQVSAVSDRSDKEACDVYYSVVDVIPEYPGGDAEFLVRVAGFLKDKDCDHLQNSKIYYVINKNGKAINLRIDGVADECTELFIEEFKKLPNWTPGYQDGKPVCVEYMMPLIYHLQAK